MNYRSHIDALRALAVLAVILYHSHLGIFKSGFIGVDVFFVISGYLITTNILTDLDKGEFGLRRFYWRRAVRLLPALYIVSIISTTAAVILMLPLDLRKFSQSLFASTINGSNIYFWITSGYFDTSNDIKPLIHTWSLSLEEQYYLIAPIVLYRSWHANRVLAFAIVSGLLIIASISLAQYRPFWLGAGDFYSIIPRGLGLFAGSTLAYIELRTKGLPGFFYSKAIKALALIAILVLGNLEINTGSYPGMAYVAPVLFSLLLLPGQIESRIGFISPVYSLLLHIGKLSYSAYLIHQPLFAFSKYYYGEIWYGARIALLLLTFVFAHILWRFIEEPVRRRSAGREKLVGSLLLSGFLLLSLTGLLIHIKEGFPSRMPASITGLDGMEMPSLENGYCFFNADSKGVSNEIVKLNSLCSLGASKNNSAFLLLGDSFAAHFDPFWDIIAKDLGFKFDSISSNWCFPGLGGDYNGAPSSAARIQCELNRKTIENNIERYDGLILGGAWHDVIATNRTEQIARLMDFACPRVSVIIVMPVPPQFGFDVASEFKKALLFGRTPMLVPSVQHMSKARAANDSIASIIKRCDKAIFIHSDDLFPEPSESALLVPFSLDGRHISVYGSKRAARDFLLSESFSRLKSKISLRSFD